MNKNYIFGLALMVCGVMWMSSADALRLTIKRIVFEGSKRAEVITVINNSTKEETYRVGWRNFIMTEEKGLKFIPDDQPMPPQIKPVTDMIRYAPRRFTVPAKSSQQIRIMLRTPADLADGEYRSHLWIRPEADVEKIRSESKGADAKTSKSKGVFLEMLAGATMPIIVRKGNLGAEVSILNLEASRSPGFVDVGYALRRVGEKSVYGNIDYICNRGNASEYNLKAARGIAVYPEINQRIFKFRIEIEQGQASCSTMTVTFKDSPDVLIGGGAVMAEASVAVR